jgi:hypothetical protein
MIGLKLTRVICLDFEHSSAYKDVFIQELLLLQQYLYNSLFLSINIIIIII